MKLLFGIICCSFLLFACKSNKDKQESTETQTAHIAYELKKGACFGTCPVIQMSIKSNGMAELNAQRNYRISGKYEAMISEDYMIKLHDAFANANFFEFPDVIESQIADLPSIEVFYNNGEKEKSVKGKEGRPTELVQLQFLLEEVCDKTEWKFIEPVESKKGEVETAIKSEIIIQFKSGTLLPRWFKKYDKYGLRIMKPIAKDQNIWLTTYNAQANSPEAVINEINEDPEVESAEFNKKVSKRSGSRN